MEPTSNDVPQNPSSAPQPAPAPAPSPAPAPPLPGANTPPENLLAALQEERALRQEESRLRREAEAKLTQLGADPSQPSYLSDEGRQLKGEVDTLTARIGQMEEDKVLDVLTIQYPILKENLDKLREFRKNEHPRAKIESVVKLFLAENGLLEPRRAGLENPTGGERAPVTKSGMSPAEAEKLRTTNWPRYQELMAKGMLDLVE